MRFLRGAFKAPTGVMWEMYNEPDLNASPNCSSGIGGGMNVGSGASRAVRPGGWYPCANATAYALLAVQLGAALKGAFPDEIYVGPALGDMHGTDDLDEGFLGVCADAGVFEYWDAVTVHPYRPFSPEDAELPLAQVCGWRAAEFRGLSTATDLPSIAAADASVCGSTLPARPDFASLQR